MVVIGWEWTAVIGDKYRAATVLRACAATNNEAIRSYKRWCYRTTRGLNLARGAGAEKYKEDYVCYDAEYECNDPKN